MRQTAERCGTLKASQLHARAYARARGELLAGETFRNVPHVPQCMVPSWQSGQGAASGNSLAIEHSLFWRSEHSGNQMWALPNSCSQSLQRHAGASFSMQHPPSTISPDCSSRRTSSSKVTSPYKISATQSEPQFGHRGGFEGTEDLPLKGNNNAH